MHRKFDVRRYLTAFFIGIFAVVGSIVAIDAPARAANDLGYNSTVDWSTSLNGTNQGWSVAEGTAFDARSTYTASAWFRMRTINNTGTHVIISHDGDYTLWVKSGTLRAYIYYNGVANGQEIDTGFKPTVNVWTHTAVVRDGTSLNLYVDGQLVKSVTLPSANPSTYQATNGVQYDLTIGMQYANQFFDGQIDEVRIWSTARTEAQLASDMHNYQSNASGTTGLVAYYDFNEASGTTVYNRVGSSGTNLTGASSPSFARVESVTKVAGKNVVSFPRSYLTPVNGWTVPAGATIANVLAVAGGGAGGSRHAGGGGAGELREFSNYSLTPTSVLPIKVGQGGRGLLATTVNPQGNKPRNGQSTTFGAVELAGGGAGAANDSVTNGAGQNGGSGGGSTYYLNAAGASVKTGSGLGNAGGAGSPAGSYHGGGGGGAGGAGANATSGGPGNGGAGYESSIEGDLKCYAAGGGGGASTNVTPGQAGSCATATSRASAGTFNTDALPAGANSGSGGGAGGLSGSTNMGSGAGGSGIVVIAYAPTDDNYFSLDGTTQYASLTGAQAIPASSGFTVEAWINPAASGAGATAVIVSQGTGSNRFYMKRYNGFLYTYRDQQQGLTGTEMNCGALPADQWTHVAIAMDGTNTYCYINGQSTKTIAFAYGTQTVGANLFVGQYSAGAGTGDQWKGGIDQVKIWNSAITDPALIARSMHAYQDQDSTGYIAGSSSSRALTAHYDFNESASNTAVEDKVGSATLNTTGSPTRTSIVATGTSGANTTYSMPRTFLSTWGGWVSPHSSNSASALVVAGGGGAGKSVSRVTSPVGGSGGGGGVTVLTGQTLVSGTVYPIIVGRGGQGASSIADDASNRNGQSSSFLGNTVLGGGGGGSSTYAGAGGSTVATGGGGGGIAGLQCAGSTNGGGVASSGYNGGQGILSWGGAGGGAGGASPARNCAQEFGTSGPGVTSSLTGASVEYGRGGFAGLATNIPASNGNPGSGGSVSYGAATGDGSGYAGINGLVFVSVKTAYTVTFDANGGSGSLTSQNINIGSSANLTANSGSLTKSGYTFAGWATTSAGTVAYADGASITPSADITLYAQWLSNSSITGNQYVGQVLTAAALTTPTPGGAATSYTYQWQSSLTSGGTYTNISGATSSTFTITCAEVGKYLRVIVVGVYTGNISSGQVVSTATGKIAASSSPVVTNDNLLIYLDAGNSCSTSTSGKWNDLSGNGNDATLAGSTGTPTLTSSAGGYYAYNRANAQYGDVGTKTFDLSAGLSISFWANFSGPASSGSWERIIDFGNGAASDNIDIGRKNATNELFLEIFRGSTSQGYCETSTSGAAIADGVWAHYSITVDSSRVCKIYKNGTALNLSTGSTSFTFSALPATVSRANNYVSKSNWIGDAAFGGGLADLALYNTGLTSSQVTSNYTAQRFVSAATPTISSHPANITKSAGETATFSVTASTSDAGTLSYQWEVSANNGSTWMNVSGGTGATTSSYTTPSLVSADLGKQYRVVVTNTLSGATATATSNAATLTIGLDKINVNFDELNFDYANVSHIVGTNGKSQGNKVLFLNVTTKNGVQVDALVTTETLTNATITNYETGARAGGANSYFQTDVDFSAANGFAQFKFDFYKHGVAGSAGNPCTTANPTCSGATKVVIQNVNVSAIDIDYYQWNDFTQAESYSLAGNTKLKECLISVANAAVGGTCTARTAPSTFPADMRFQGSPDTARTNDPVDMAIVTYADIETFRIKFGRDRAGSPNYYGVAFKALDWGTTTPQTTGGTNYTISYDVNGASSGSQSGTHVGAAGSLFTVLSAGTAVRTGYTFAGWATTANATTATYTGSSKVTMPGSNLTLYAVWTPIKYTLTYNVNGGTGAPAAGSFETGTNNVTLSSTVPTRTGFVFGGWDTVVNSGSGNVNYSSGATYSMPASNVTLYAKWTAANGTLSYNANGGSTTQADVTAAGGSTTTVANGSNTTRTGYDFVGWNSKADGTGTSYAVGSTFTLTANVTTTIYAQWTLSKYTLVFNVNGGVGTPQSQSYVQGATTTMPVSNPTRSGFTFAGWNSQADGNGTAYNGSFLMPGNNLTLYAKWTAITYNVIYNNNSATYSGATGTVTDSTNYTAAQSVTVAAGTGLSNTTGSTTYVFTGWNTAADGSGTDFVPSSTFSMPAGNRTLYAMWVDASIEIAYNANGGSGAPANANTTLNSTFTISSTVPVRAGYTFAGWNVQDGNPGGGPHSAGGTITPNSNEVLVAQWTAVNYTVTFDTDGGSTAPSQQTNKNIGNTISISATAPTKTGYTFLGWKDAAGNVYPAGGSFIMGAGNVTLTAQWQGNAYTLTYDANGGSGAPVAESRNYTASANLSATQPTRTGYTFQGWNTLVGGGGTAYNASDSFTMPNSNATLYAQWTANSYVLAYNTQGGSTAPSSSNKSYNSTVTVSSSTPTRTGFTFAGWNTVAAGTGTTYLPSGTFSMPDANVTLYSQWTKTAFTLYYNTNGGQGVFSSQPVKYGESVTVDSTAPTKTGYTFSGWNTAADGSGFDYSPRMTFTLNVEANVTLFAKWTAISYSLAYNANGGSGAPSGGSYNFGATVTTASKGSMALSGYRFIGWNDRADGTGTTYLEGATFSMPAENVILYAQWIDALFEIAYNANGGSGGPDGADVPDGTSYTVDPIQPVRPGYTFSGWKIADGTPTTSTYKAGTSTQTFTISGNEVLVAQWTIKTITVTYDLNGGGGTTPTAGSGNYNSNITLASSSGVSRSNFQFVGWSTTPDGTGTTYVDGSSYKLPANDVILYAKWAPVYYVIEYNAAGGTGEPADQFATPSSTVAIATQEPTKTGYEFDKWTEVSQGTDFTPGASLTMPSSNVVLVANYTVRTAGVPGSGSGSNTGVVDPGTKPISKPKELVLSVYFRGDSPVLTERAKMHLRKLAATAKSYGRANNITIYGRVKETNDKSYDLRLSRARAANVAAYLKKYGVTGVFKVYAKGISPENTFKSRRVDMKLWWAK